MFSLRAVPNHQSKTPVAPLLWVGFCAYCNLAGWVLSAVHQLNVGGYSVAIALGLLAVWLLRGNLPSTTDVTRSLRWPRWRFRHLFPLGFLILAALALLGGVIHAPNNYDALAYRTPRVLHWLAEGRWHWVHTDFGRLNNRGCGIEWVTAPLLAFTHSDRGIFLLNAVSFLLLPGRVFSLFIRLGVNRRVAWHWMWVLPTGYCYLLQAGSIGNDLFGALLAMTAIEFAMRARQSGRPLELWVAILAAALMTAGKAFNMVLLLPWAIAVWPSLRLLGQRPVLTALAIVVGISASLVPSAVLNHKYCGDWKGLAAEPGQILGGSPTFRLPVNVVLITLHNFTPTIFPLAPAWNRAMERIIPPGLSEKLHTNFEPFGAGLRTDEMQMEEQTGIGFGVSVLLVATLIYRLVHRSRKPRTTGLLAWAFKYETLVPLATWAAAAAFMAQSGLSCPARYLAPFYVLMIAPLLAGDGGLVALTRLAWWRSATIAVYLLAALLVVISPARPLWPATTILRALGADHASGFLVKRAWAVYSVYGSRSDGFAPARAALPPDANPLGVITFDDPETSLWRPFGTRRILHVQQADTPEQTRARGIRYILLSSNSLTNHYKISLDEWLRQNDADLVQRLSLNLRAGTGPRDWYLVKVR